MDHSEFDMESADLPQRAGRSQALVRRIEPALPESLVRRARRAIARLGNERFRKSYFTTFWLARGSQPAHALEDAVLALWKRAGIRCAGVEWWIGRAHTNRLPIEFHFDHDVKGRVLRHPRVSSVFFFNSVRGGHLAVTDARPGTGPATRMEPVKPRRNRYAMFRGNLLHGVLDGEGRTPARGHGGRGRVRITLVVNFWDRRPTGVPTWQQSGVYRSLRTPAGAKTRAASDGRWRNRGPQR
jgi:hypothetical protein